MTTTRNNPRPDEDAEVRKALRETFGADIRESDKRRLQKPFDKFRNDLTLHPYVQELGRPGNEPSYPWLRRLAVATSVGLVGVILTLALFAGGGAPAWADVVERFRSVDSFKATVYFKEDATARAEQVELWVGGGRVRIHVGSQVIFAHGGEVTRALDIEKKREVEAHSMASQLVEKLGASTSFSLESVIQTMPGGDMMDVTPRLNPGAGLADDMVVFDVQSRRTPEWLRIWALRESKLPLRVRVWDPRDGESVEAVFSYANRQPEEFFDPDAFEAALKGSESSRGRANRLYALMRDPVGHDVTPRDVFESKSGYHVPTVESVGMTEKGAVWIVASNSRNRKPDGGVFSGFQSVEDDLSRQYRRVYSSHRVAGDRSFQIFVPEDYPFDTRRPEQLTFACKPDGPHRDSSPGVVGKVKFTDWDRTETWPRKDEHSPGRYDALVQAGRHFLRQDDYNKCEKVMDMIPGEPATDSHALRRERLQLSMLLEKQEYEAAASLGERLMPFMEKEYLREPTRPSPYPFSNCILALAAEGNIEKAGEAYALIRDFELQFSDRLNARARAHITGSFERDRARFAERLRERLAGEAGLTDKEIAEVLGE